STARAAAQKHLNALLSGAHGRHGSGSSLGEEDARRLHPPLHPRPVTTLLEADSKPYIKRFEWITRDRKNIYVIVVARPYWLARLTSSSDDVIWAPVGASILSCVAPR